MKVFPLTSYRSAPHQDQRQGATNRDPATAERRPWRVEGARPEREQREGWIDSWQRPGGSRFWWILLALLVLNWVISSAL